NYFYVFYPAEGVDASPQSMKIAWDSPSVFNWGPRDEAVSKKPWDIMISLGFSYGPYDPAGTVTALLAQKGTFNAYGYYPGKDLMKMKEQAKTTTDQQKAFKLVKEMLRYLAIDQPLVFTSNPISIQGYWNGPDRQIANIGGKKADSYFDFVDQTTLYWKKS
ncbi:MAG: peptide-binding protein, partial [Halobacteriaceae archaeon]